jgi:hypothetical protein
METFAQKKGGNGNFYFGYLRKTFMTFASLVLHAPTLFMAYRSPFVRWTKRASHIRRSLKIGCV